MLRIASTAAGIFLTSLLVGPAWSAEASVSGTTEPGKALDLPGHAHPGKCDACTAAAIWESFVQRLRTTGHEDLIPADAENDAAPAGGDVVDAGGDAVDAGGDAAHEHESAESAESAPKHGAAKQNVDLQATDPIRGVLFRMSNDLVNLDAIFQEAQGKPLDEATREKAQKLAARIRSSEDPFLKAYGDFHAARLDLEEGKHSEAAKALDGLVKSCYFLPKREARRHLAGAYRGTGDDTLAILEIQFFLNDLPPENEVDRAWAREELRRIREKNHEGPLHDSETSMRSVSTLVSGLDVGEGTQGKARRVEDVIDKVAKLLDLMAGNCKCGGACQSCAAGMCSGSGQGQGQGAGQASGKQGQGKEGKDGKGAGQHGSPENSDQLAKAAGQTALRDATASEKDAWGRINDRDVARSLRELWDKIPGSYRMTVIQYFKDISDPESPKEDK
jgi:hypothetical protein